MNQFHDAPLSIEEGRAITATIAHWGETPTKSGGFSLAACSYGAVLMVNGESVRQIWGAGYAPNPIPTIALAVSRVLEIVKSGSPITVNALGELGRYFGPNGIVARATGLSGRSRNTGRKLSNWPTMKYLQAQYAEGTWRLVARSDMWGAQAFPDANNLARRIGKREALAHKATVNPTSADFPDAVILQGGAI